MPTPTQKAMVSLALFFSASSNGSATEQGLASFYGAWRAGDMTAAHRSLPMGTRVKVMNLDNGRAIVVKIVDRGPFIRGRVIDLSSAAAESLGFKDAGLARVKIVAVSADAFASEAGGEGHVRPAVFDMSAYAICRYGAADLARVEKASFGDAGVASDDTAECEGLRPGLVAVSSGRHDLDPSVASHAANGGLEAAASIPVSALTRAVAAENLPIGPLFAALEKSVSQRHKPCGDAC